MVQRALIVMDDGMATEGRAHDIVVHSGDRKSGASGRLERKIDGRDPAPGRTASFASFRKTRSPSRSSRLILLGNRADPQTQCR
jgi:hypothetical protein